MKRDGSSLGSPGGPTRGSVDEEQLEAFAALARQIGPPLSARQRSAGWQRLRQTQAQAQRMAGTTLADQERPGGRRRWGWLWDRPLRSCLAAVVGVAALAVPAGVWWAHRGGPRPLEYVVSGEEESVSGGAPGQVRSSRTGRAQVLFSDGSRVGLHGAARVTVAQLTARGADVRVLDGVIDVDVRHLPGTVWTFEAGPYTVHVEGTSFELGWNAAERRLSLGMRSGRVALELGQQVAREPGRAWRQLGAGESVNLDEAGNPLPPASPSELSGAPSPSLSPSPSPPLSPSSSPSPAPVAAVAATVPSPTARQRPGRRRGPGEEPRHRLDGELPEHAPFAPMLAQGDFDAIVAEATRHGLDACLAADGEQNLAALADAARYTQRKDLARRTLQAVRTRFPGSDRARDAAFFLGRLDESAHAQSREALSWYARYLEESPAGSYAEEALGRQMILLGEARDGADRARARAVAHRYLADFPHGLYAGAASGLVRDPSAP